MPALFLEGEGAVREELGFQRTRCACGLCQVHCRHMPGTLHPADLATDHSEQEKTMGLLEREQQTLHEITAALARIEQGIFGRCEECAEEIPEARLEAVPYARHCIDCARKIEAEAGYGAATRS